MCGRSVGCFLYRWLGYPAVGRSVGRALVDGFDQEKERAGDGLLCDACAQRGTSTNRRNAEIQKQQTSWRYKKQKTRRDDRLDGSRIGTRMKSTSNNFRS